jgi:putative endonuclease
VTLTERTRFGRAGETIARTHLERLGLQFVEANWHCRAGELDLVMTSGKLLVFVEVKTRRSELAGAAEESLTAKQTARILKAAEWYVAEHPNFADHIWRIDLIAITIAKNGAVVRFSHYENAIVAG